MFRRAVCIIAVLLGGSSCSGASGESLSTEQRTSALAPAAAPSILVVAPHPDDDIITSSGVIVRALRRGAPVHVVFMTNGDAYLPDGMPRQDEAVAAQGVLGVPENGLMFLGYPDGNLKNMFENFTSATQGLTSTQGSSATYADRGLGHADYHSYKFGSPALYNRPNLLQDLVSILTTYQPTDIFTTNVDDAHDDHATTYSALVAALSQVSSSLPSYQPTLHSTIVWSSSDVWPPPADPTAYIPIDPNLEWYPELVWSQRESLDVPLSMQVSDLANNLKARAVAQHVTQGGQSGGFITTFIHKDEFFWAERTWTTTNRAPVVNAGLDQRVLGRSQVQLDGTGSGDPEATPLVYRWNQVDGPAVMLSDASSAVPTFTAPNTTAVLSFELTVSDGINASPPDGVSVYVTYNDGGVPEATIDATPDVRVASPDATVDSPGSDSRDGSGDASADGGSIDAGPPRDASTNRDASVADAHIPDETATPTDAALGVDASGDRGTAPSDAAPVDASPRDARGNVMLDAQAFDAAPTGSPGDGSGCGCRVPSRASGGHLAWLVALVAVAARRRRAGRQRG